MIEGDPFREHINIGHMKSIVPDGMHLRVLRELSGVTSRPLLIIL